MKSGDFVVRLVMLAVALTLVSRIGDPLGVRADSWSEAEVKPVPKLEDMPAPR